MAFRRFRLSLSLRQGNRMNAKNINSSPFAPKETPVGCKGEVGWGMGLH